jgi:hypothetical protein
MQGLVAEVFGVISEFFDQAPYPSRRDAGVEQITA